MATPFNLQAVYFATANGKIYCARTSIPSAKDLKGSSALIYQQYHIGELALVSRLGRGNKYLAWRSVVTGPWLDCGLTTVERAGNPIFHTLWSFVPVA